MSVRKSLLLLIPRHSYCYRTSVQRQMRCSDVLMTNPKKKDSGFPLYRKEVGKWRIEEKKQKIFDRFLKPMPERETEKKVKFTVFDGLKKRYPRVYELYRAVKNGFWNLTTDFKDLVKMNYQMRKGELSVKDMNFRDLQVFYEGFFHVKRMMPVFILGVLPFGNFLVAFLLYTKPLKYLTPHFWTENQKAIFVKEQHSARVSVFKPLIQHLRRSMPKVDRSPVYPKIRRMLDSVLDGRTPTTSELIECKAVFSANDIFSLTRLPFSHLDDLLKLHGLKSFIGKSTWLVEWSSYLHLVDARIRREGGVSNLSSEQLRRFCFQRGVNSNAMTEEEMCRYLNRWLEFSSQIPSGYSSLLLHAPALIGYNHKSNFSVTEESS